MTVARTLDERLKKWRPQTARKVERLIAQIISLADEDAQKPVRRLNGRSKKDPFFADKTVWRGRTPRDLARNHDEYLYGKDE
jgi:hypothetical protein